jgi:hypothetical protein
VNLLHLFIPHPKTHQRSPLLHWHFLLIYLLLFILLKVSFDIVGLFQPGILGVNSNITVEQVIGETNKEREKLGLPPLEMNSSLNQAATLKAQNMLEENYWAHYSPSGKDPWGFILSSGYKFAYAGENLARNFYTSEDTVKAWMNSPSHRENIVSGKYKEIGVAVVDGVLLGQKTTLVVQMFGTTTSDLAEVNPEVNVGGQKITVPKSEIASTQPVLALNNPPKVEKALVDPFQVTKGVGMGIILGISALLLIDLMVLRRRGILQFSHHHFAHLSLLALTGTTLITSHGGQIL